MDKGVNAIWTKRGNCILAEGGYFTWPKGSKLHGFSNANGYDQNWCLNTYKNGKGDDTKPAASLYAPNTGILLEMFTNEPGVQVYTGNFLEGKIVCKNGLKYPDSPNKKNFPSPYLSPGETYRSHVAYKFSIR